MLNPADSGKILESSTANNLSDQASRPVTFLREASQQRGRQTVVFGQNISSKNKAFFIKGLSTDGTTLSLSGYEYGTSPDLSTVENFLRDNPHITHLEWRGAELTDEEVNILSGITTLKSVDNPGVSDMSRKGFKR